MQKYFLIAVVGLILLTGCGKSQIKCSATLSESGITMSLVGELDGANKITNVSYEYEFKDATNADQYCNYVKLSYKDAQCNENKIIIPDATSMLEEQTNQKVIGMTKTEFIEFAQKDAAGVTCK